MKKTLLLFGVLFFWIGTTFATPTPELLEDLITQILTQQTLKKSWKEVLDQLKPIFSHCATSHKDKAVQSLCKSFLEKQFASLEKEREKVQTGGVVFTKLGKLTDEEWLERIWLKEIAKKGWKRDYKYYKDMHRFDYYVAELKHYPFSIFFPHIDLSEGEKEYCRKYKQCVDQVFANIRKFYPWASPWSNLWHKTPLAINSQVNVYNGRVEVEKHSLHGKTFEQQINEIEAYYNARSDNKFRPIEYVIYFDDKGTIYTKEKDGDSWLRNELISVGNEVKPIKAWEEKNLKKRYLGLWPNFQKALQGWNAKIVQGLGSFIWLPSHPNEYFSINIVGDVGEWTNMIRVIELDNPDGTSPFLRK